MLAEKKLFSPIQYIDISENQSKSLLLYQIGRQESSSYLEQKMEN